MGDKNPNDMKMVELIAYQEMLRDMYGPVKNWPEPWKSHAEEMNEKLKPARDAIDNVGKLSRDMNKVLPKSMTADYISEPPKLDIEPRPEIKLLKNILKELQAIRNLLEK